MILSPTDRCVMFPEVELLLHGASALFAPEAEISLGRLPAENLNWERFLAAVHFHRAVYPVFRFLSNLPPGGISLPVVDKLRSIQLNTLAFNLKAARELVQVMAALQKADCPAIAYKGPLLAVSAYKDLGARVFTDLDVLVRPGDFGRVCRVLGRLDYRPAESPPAGPFGLTLRLLRDVVFLGETGRTPLEVQWRIAQRYHPVFPNPQELWSRCRPTKLEGAELLTFSPEDTLLILCLHGLYHAWGVLQQVTDVGAVINGLRPDWTLTLDLARQSRAERILFLGLLLARRLLGVELPGWVLDRASSDRVAASVAQDSARRFFQTENWEAKARRFFFREAKMFPGLGNRARYVLGRLTTPNEEDLAGKSLTWGMLAGLPFRRFARLFRKYLL